ncbi:MAG: DUF4230 domain-containing protein [Muribaculaceae bacterium]|nr:DUF4230 domain-containing protein [Muribaculaceae bacterium]
MKKSTHRIRSGLIFFLPLLILSLMGGGCEKRSGDEARAEDVAPVPDYYSLIRSADKLILSEMTINKMATVEDLGLNQAKGSKQTMDAILNLFKIGTRKGAYSYNTYLRAYIDLSELTPGDVEVDTAARLIRVSLPEIRTEFAGRDVEVREDHYRVTGLRTNIGADERARVKEAMNEALRKEVEERAGFRDRLTASAREKALAYFTAFAAENGYTAEIKFK